MKKKLIITGVAMLVAVFAIHAVQTYNVVVSDPNAIILTNRVTSLNSSCGTTYTVPQAVNAFGTQDLLPLTNFNTVVIRERRRVERLLGAAYFSASQSTRNNVNSALGITP